MTNTPRVFISYSHDSPTHKQWTRKLAADLRSNGVDVIIDQWDLSPGDDIASFMEQGLKQADRVVVVCSKNYVERANSGQGGVGYEKMIVTAELIDNLGTKKFIPIIRGSGDPPVPTFLGYRLYIDFEDDDKYKSSLETLLREIHNVPDPGKPPIGPNPFDAEGHVTLVVSPVELQPTKQIPLPEDLHEVTEEDLSPLVNTLKKFIAEQAHVMKIHDLLIPIANAARERLEKSALTNYGDQPKQTAFLHRIAVANDSTNKLCRLFAVGCPWTNAEQAKTFGKALGRVSLVPNPTGSYYEIWESVTQFPALRVLYSGAIAAMSTQSFDVLRQLMVEMRSRTRQREPEAPLIQVLHSGARFAQSYWKWLPGRERHHFPVSDYLEETLRPVFRELSLGDEELVAVFDKFEFFQSMIYGDLSTRDRFWAPLGTYVWRRRDIFNTVRAEIQQQGTEWKPLKSGLFSGSVERVTNVLAKLEDFTERVRGQLGIW